MPILNPYVLLGAVIVSIGIFFAGYTKGSNDKYTEWQLTIAAQAKASRDKEYELQKKADENAKQAQKDKQAIQYKLDAANERLRNRPERMPESTRTHCSGTTGAELSGEDGRFLIGEAARADSIRKALESCYRHVDMP